MTAIANSVLLSAMTVIAITGITLTTLKYTGHTMNNDHSDVDIDWSDDDNYTDINDIHINPKFYIYNMTEHKNGSNIVKRSINDHNPIQYFIDNDSSMVDIEKREKVKQVNCIEIYL